MLADALDGRAYHDAFKVLRQQQVATTTYYNIVFGRLTQDLSHLLSLLDVLIFQETAATGVNAEGVML